MAAVTLREWTVGVVSRLPPQIVRSTGSRDSATLGEIRRSTGDVVGSVVGSIIGSVTVRLKQPCVLGCSLMWELWRCTLPISDSTLVALVEAPSSSSTVRGLSEAYQKKGLGAGQRCTRGLTLTVASPTGST